jgi:hypothetical protein
MVSRVGSRLTPITDINRPITAAIKVNLDGQPHVP